MHLWVRSMKTSQTQTQVSKPITPSEVGAAKAATFPAAVFDAFNAEIAAECVNGRALVKQAAVVARMKAAGLSSEDIDKKGWLNVEDAYRAAGWTVTYDKQGFNETGEAYFEFKAKRR